MRKKLLLADDSLTIQKVIESILTEENFEIKSIGDGNEAWVLLKEYMPDVILADIDMPGMKGYELCEKVKQDERTRHIPVILLASVYEPINEDRARAVQADDFIIKPFESEELINKIISVFSIPESVDEAASEALEEGVPFVEDEVALKTPDVLSGKEPEIAKKKEEPAEKSKGEITFEEKTGSAKLSEEEPSIPSLEITKEKISNFLASIKASQSYNLFMTSLENNFKEIVNSLDFRTALIENFKEFMQTSIENMLKELIPALIEKTFNDMIAEINSSLKKQGEQITREAVLGFAGAAITREIEKLKSSTSET